MSDMEKNYVGKVVRMEFTWQGQPQNKVGYVYDHKTVGNMVEFSLCLTTGQEWNPRFTPSADLKISSVRMDKDLRDALKAFGDARASQKAFLQRFEEEKRQHEKNIEQKRRAVQAVSKDMSIGEMMIAVEKLFEEAYPRTRSLYNDVYFDCTSGSNKEVTMTQIRDVEKYASPEKYPFIYREYDDTLFLRHESKAYKKFCEEKAPPVIPALKGFKNEVGASIGDKNWLTVGRSYTIPLKHGLTKDSLEEIKDVLSGKSRKSSLDAQIQSANGKKSSTVSMSRKNEKER